MARAAKFVRVEKKIRKAIKNLRSRIGSVFGSDGLIPPRFSMVCGPAPAKGQESEMGSVRSVGGGGQEENSAVQDERVQEGALMCVMDTRKEEGTLSLLVVKFVGWDEKFRKYRGFSVAN